MQTIGKIDLEIYKVVSSGIKSSRVVITEERITHIQERHPNDFDRYSGYISKMLLHP